MLTKTATVHIAAEDLTFRPNLRSITPPAIMPNMAEGIFMPPVKKKKNRCMKHFMHKDFLLKYENIFIMWHAHKRVIFVDVFLYLMLQD